MHKILVVEYCFSLSATVVSADAPHTTERAHTGTLRRGKAEWKLKTKNPGSSRSLQHHSAAAINHTRHVQLALDYVLQYKHDFKNSLGICWRRVPRHKVSTYHSIQNIRVPTCQIKQSQQRGTLNDMEASQLFPRFIHQHYCDNETNAKIINMN